MGFRGALLGNAGLYFTRIPPACLRAGAGGCGGAWAARNGPMFDWGDGLELKTVLQSVKQLFTKSLHELD